MGFGSGGQGGHGSGYGLGGLAAGLGSSLGDAGGVVGSGGSFNEGADDFAASTARSGTGGLVSDEEAGQIGTEATGAAAEGEAGMGGFPGGLNSQDKKRKRRPRPHYLIEDPETWETGAFINPPVIM
jgi:hypothetical protein